MKDIFTKLINSFVKPNHPKIKAVDVYVLGAMETKMYVVRIRSYYDLQKEERKSINKDVRQVFDSMSLPKTSDFMISYSKLG